MKTKLAVTFGILALAGVGAVALVTRREPGKAAQRTRPAAPKTAPELPEAQEAAASEESRGVKAEERRDRKTGEAAHRLLRSGSPEARDREALALMGRPVPELLAGLRKAFLEEQDTKERLRLAHILIAQHRRFGHAVEIDAEVLAFLTAVVSDPEKEADHGPAIAALARWETDGSFRALGRVMADVEDQERYAKAAEWLSESRDPRAAATILEAFQATDDEDGKMVAANALLKLASEYPELGLAPILRGQVRPALEKLLARAESEWSRKSIAKMLEALP